MPSTPATQRRRRARLRAAGMCTRCTKRDAGGLSTCQPCRDEIRARKDRYRAAGDRCGECGRRGTLQHFRCKPCRDANRRSVDAIRRQRAERGDCVRCGREMPEAGWYRCPVCQDSENAYQTMRKAVMRWRS